jgi:mono/diheme cytochrome c family protein
MRLRHLLALALVAVPTLAGSLRAEYDPIFDFIPLGGRSLLAQVLESKPPAADARALLSAKRSRDQWVEELKARTTAIPALQALEERELLTLADYLAFNAPLPAARMPADPAKADWMKVLPRDGRDLALEYCQSCHIITVTITQDRTREHWLGTMNKPSHVEIKLTPREREALASYLVLNAGIPIDQVPVDLRAGGASY